MNSKHDVSMSLPKLAYFGRHFVYAN